MQSIDRNHDGHVLRDGDSSDLHGLLGCSFQPCNGRVKPGEGVSVALSGAETAASIFQNRITSETR